MITDPLFYRLFETSPETFFMVLGMTADAAKATAARYRYQAIEFKETAHRTDGVARAKTEIPDEALRADLIELIETVVIYKLPRLSREEIQAMLKVQDIRETRVYQEALEEGETKATARAIVLAAKKLTAEEIASLLEVDIEVVREVLRNRN